MLSSCVQERNGSSLQAITKHVGDKHPSLPGPWKKVLSNHVRKLKLSGKLVQVTPSAATLSWEATLGVMIVIKVTGMTVALLHESNSTSAGVWACCLELHPRQTFGEVLPMLAV